MDSMRDPGREALRAGVSTGFANRVVFVVLVLGAVALAVKLTSLWLMVFGAVIFATVIRALATPLIRWLKMPEPAAAFAALIGLASALGLIFYLFGRELVLQAQGLVERLPHALGAIEAELNHSELGAVILAQLRASQFDASGLTSQIPALAGNIAEGLANGFVVVVAGTFLAMRPSQSLGGILMLVPPEHKARVGEALEGTGQSLRQWLMAQCVSMVLVGTLVGGGLWAIGVPSAMALGLISGLAQFVPLIGPIISAVPGLVLAAADGGHSLLWALILYVGVSQLESNLITPMVQRHVASVPVVLTLFAVVGFGTLFGAAGVFFATPLTVVLHGLVLKLYVARLAANSPEETSEAGNKSA